MTSAPPRGVIEHDVRLAILACLSERGPLTLAAVGANIGVGTGAVMHHATLLEDFELIRPRDSRRTRRSPYQACLRDQPDWVVDAVEDFKPGR